MIGLAANCEAALRLAAREPPDICFVDLKLAGDTDGIETATQLKTRFGCRIVIATGYPASIVDEARLQVQPCCVLQKPYSAHAVQHAMRRCLVPGASEDEATAA